MNTVVKKECGFGIYLKISKKLLIIFSFVGNDLNITGLLNYCQNIDISVKLENIFMVKGV